MGDGVADDLAAFNAADDAAAGKIVLVSPGTYYLSNSITFDNPVQFEGTVTMAEASRLVLRRNFDLPSYSAAFGGELAGFKRAVQALFFFTDHDFFQTYKSTNAIIYMCNKIAGLKRLQFL